MHGSSNWRTLAGMDDIDDLDFIHHWDELDEFARSIVRSGQGALWPTLALSFVGSRPDLLVEAPVFAAEESDEIVSALIAFFGALRPERLAVLWPNRYELDDGLRTLYSAKTRRRIERRGWFAVPDKDGWCLMTHPASTTLLAFDRVDAI